MNTLPSKLTAKFRVEPTGCWRWLAATTSGYGHVRHEGRVTYAHRAVYGLLVGAIPHGHDLHHLCGLRLCVNPEHLRPVEFAAHRRSHSPLRTHCRRQHALADHNVIVRNNGHRTCRECGRQRQAKYHARLRRARLEA